MWLQQGWRLFAEAHGVQPGDQVSFELVSPTRLVVKLMTTEEAKRADAGGRSNATSTNLDDTPRSVDSPAVRHTLPLLATKFSCRHDSKSAHHLVFFQHDLEACTSRP